MLQPCVSAQHFHTHLARYMQCMAEVRRLEEAKVAQMVDIVNDKARELLELCHATHIAPPEGLRHCIAEINSDARNPGAAADLLAKLVRMLAEVQVSGCVLGWDRYPGSIWVQHVSALSRQPYGK